MNKKAFSFIEIIISLTILILLAVIATTATGNIKNNSTNSRVIADLNTVKNGLSSYSLEGNILPKPKGNNNYFQINGVYAYDFSDENTFGAYGKITNESLENRYLNAIPLDPRTNQFYSYGIAKNSNQFELAGIIYKDGNYIAKVEGNYTAENGPYSLIREYNGPNFVIDRGFNLPYNPEQRVLVAKTSDGKVYKEGDTIINNSTDDLEIYLSDGSIVSIIPNSELTLSKLDFPTETNLASKVILFLKSGSAWIQAAKLSEDSSFDIFTTDVTASVRGTVFNIEKIGSNSSSVTVVEGIVHVTKIESIDHRNIIDFIETINHENYIDSITNGGTTPDQNIRIEVLDGANPKKITIQSGTSSVINEVSTGNIISPIKTTQDVNKAIEINNVETNNLLTSEQEDRICKTFTINSICQDSENTLGDDWQLYAYAPYNANMDFKMYSSRNDNITVTHGDTLNHEDGRDIDGWNWFGTGSSFYSKGENTGVLIRSIGEYGYLKEDHLKYDLLNGSELGNNFAIEIGVRGSALKKDTGVSFLYSFGDNYLKIKEGSLRMGYYYNGIHTTTFETQIKKINKDKFNNLVDNKIYKIITKYEGANWILKLDDIYGEYGYPTIPEASIDSIYIGSDSNKNKQWNDLIEYVKIYKKNP